MPSLSAQRLFSGSSRDGGAGDWWRDMRVRKCARWRVVGSVRCDASNEASDETSFITVFWDFESVHFKIAVSLIFMFSAKMFSKKKHSNNHTNNHTNNHAESHKQPHKQTHTSRLSQTDSHKQSEQCVFSTRLIDTERGDASTTPHQCVSTTAHLKL